ncbi:SRPBCC family protein [Aeromicrobium sp. Leaf350]|uniref:SRPBCC family protein n=1 Tax=Aeromicrobium sp. Leaf350 TaxID=2876565 RepID=UPI001E549807|nr:SRPBCC family protein [Aeromicrobium sp. Leaf350]
MADQEISIVRVIEAPADAAWAVVSNFGGLATWNPEAVDVAVTGAGTEMVRRVSVTNGSVIEERLTTFDSGARHMEYVVSATEPPSPVAGMVASIGIHETSSGRACVEWKVTFPPSSPPSTESLAAVRESIIRRIGYLGGAASAVEG